VFYFEGKPNEDMQVCVLHTYLPFIFIVGGCVDVCNTVVFLSLFVVPLYRLYTTNKDSFHCGRLHKKQMSSMLWFNIIGSVVCTLSSFIYLFTALWFGDSIYFRMGEQIDLFINSTAVFFMLATNRSYIFRICAHAKRDTFTDLEKPRQDDHEHNLLRQWLENEVKISKRRVSQYAHIFVVNGFDMDSIKHIDSVEVLKNVGISDEQYQKQILQQARMLHDYEMETFSMETQGDPEILSD